MMPADQLRVRLPISVTDLLDDLAVFDDRLRLYSTL